MADSRSDKLTAFVHWTQAHITGDEKGQAQIFLDRLFQAFGHEGTPGQPTSLYNKGILKPGATMKFTGAEAWDEYPWLWSRRGVISKMMDWYKTASDVELVADDRACEEGERQAELLEAHVAHETSHPNK